MTISRKGIQCSNDIATSTVVSTSSNSAPLNENLQICNKITVNCRVNKIISHDTLTTDKSPSTREDKRRLSTEFHRVPPIVEMCHYQRQQGQLATAVTSSRLHNYEDDKTLLLQYSDDGCEYLEEGTSNAILDCSTFDIEHRRCSTHLLQNNRLSGTCHHVHNLQMSSSIAITATNDSVNTLTATMQDSGGIRPHSHLYPHSHLHLQSRPFNQVRPQTSCLLHAPTNLLSTSQGHHQSNSGKLSVSTTATLSTTSSTLSATSASLLSSSSSSSLSTTMLPTTLPTTSLQLLSSTTVSSTSSLLSAAELLLPNDTYSVSTKDNDYASTSAATSGHGLWSGQCCSNLNSCRCFVAPLIKAINVRRCVLALFAITVVTIFYYTHYVDTDVFVG